MIIIKSKGYLKDYDKLIKRKHLVKEENRIKDIEKIINAFNNMQELFASTYKNIYNFEQKKENLKEIFTVRINHKLRLVMKPLIKYPYSYIEIEKLEFINIDDKHYGEG